MRATAIASYMPESMLIRIGPELRIYNEQGLPEPLPTADALGYFFHEYAHYLHNISTTSGIAAFINTLELWRTFRHTIGANGHGAGSAGLSPDWKTHLTELLAYLDAARQNHSPPLSAVISPAFLTVSAFRLETDVQGTDGPLLGALICDAKIRDKGGQAEALTIKVGTLELLEGAAWLLEKRMVEAVHAGRTAEPPPIFPYRVAEAIAASAVPGISEDCVLACILTALQSSDAPAALLDVLAIARAAADDGRDPVTVLRESAKDAIAKSELVLEGAFASLNGEFNGNGVMAIAIRGIVDAARAGFAARRQDPFFELEMIRGLGTGEQSINDVLLRMPSCAVLQRNSGAADELGKDYLLSFLPANDANEYDPENGIRIVHSMFDYIGRHRRVDHLAPTSEALRGSCPFFTCCTLALRQAEPRTCQNTPWEAVDWSGWNHNGACWYGTGIQITRPPAGAGGESSVEGSV